MSGPALEVSAASPTAQGERSSRSDHVGDRGSEAEVLSGAGLGERSSRSDHVGDRGSEAEVLRKIQLVDDPEYPGVSIVDLGLVEFVRVDGGRVEVGLVPTFSGCPALAMIASDVEAAVRRAGWAVDVVVSWLTSPAWGPERLSQRGRDALASNFTVAVQIGDRTPECPLCGGPTVEQSMFGPSRCRAVHRCDACSETVEVMRG